MQNDIERTTPQTTLRQALCDLLAAVDVPHFSEERLERMVRGELKLTEGWGGMTPRQAEAILAARRALKM